MDTTTLHRILDEIDYGLMVVGPRGQLRMANRIALAECEDGRSLQLSGGVIEPRDAVAQSGFRSALKDAAGGRRGMLILNSPHGKQSLAVVPVQESASTPAAAQGDPTVLLVFGRRNVCQPLSVEFFARKHRATLAETAVLRGLCQGHSPRELAASGGVAISTVRSQINSLRQKTGARNIGELVRIVTVLPPIVVTAGYAAQ